MEHRAEYVTDCEYAAAGLSLVEAELEVCRLREELATLQDQYLFALCVVRCLLRDNGKSEQTS